MSSLAAPFSDPSAQLYGIDIAKLLSSESPVVKCVLLRAAANTPAASNTGETDQKLPAKKMAADDDDNTKKSVLADLIDEIEVDTTPKKQMVTKILKGPFTFLGQYEDEGIVLMASRPNEDDDDEDDESKLPPINPHQLQPPLDDMQVHGDILVMKVAPTDEVLDNDNDDVDEEAAEQKQVVVPTGDEFFLDYTKEEYIAFASRTDIVAPERPGERSEEEEIEESDDEDEEYVAEDDVDDEEDDKEHHVAMMNLIMGQLLRRFQEENGRGPDTRELLEIRSALAEKMGIDVPGIDVEGADWDQKAEKKPSKVVDSEVDPKSPTKPILVNKRSLEEEESPDAQETKKVKFTEPSNEPEAKITPESEKATADA